MAFFRYNKNRKLIIVLALLIVVAVSGFFYVTKVMAATRTWDGGCGADTSWSCANNWSNNTRPGSGDAVVFNSTSTNNSTVDASFAGTVTSVSINSGYTGTITMARSLTVSSDFTQGAGSFTAAGQTLDINGAFALSNGIFTASSGTMTVAGDFTISGGTFNHNSGTITFDGNNSTLTCNNATFNLVTFNKGDPDVGVIINSDCSLPLGSSPSLTIDTNSGNG